MAARQEGEKLLPGQGDVHWRLLGVECDLGPSGGARHLGPIRTGWSSVHPAHGFALREGARVRSSSVQRETPIPAVIASWATIMRHVQRLTKFHLVTVLSSFNGSKRGAGVCSSVG